MLVCLTLLSVAASPPAQSPTPEPGLTDLRASGARVLMLDGRVVPISDLIGEGHPVVLDLWATWCSPCRKQVGTLTALAGRYHEQGLVILGLTIEPPATDSTRVREFVQREALPYPVGYCSDSLYRFLHPGAVHLTVPRVSVYSADGRLIHSVDRYWPWKTDRDLTHAVARAVKP
jgi:thiol-disulfide isomerase/thioredoxin